MRANAATQSSADIVRDMWQKWVFLASIASGSPLTSSMYRDLKE
jgi:hypothetical protein